MLTSKHSAATREHSIIVQPNASLNRQSAMLFFVGISLVSLLIVVRFAMLGAWIILPFSLAELSLLGFCLLKVLKSNQRMESIHIKNDTVTVTRKDAVNEDSTQFHRYWVQLVSNVDKSSVWRPARLLLRSHGRSREIGNFINNEEKKSSKSISGSHCATAPQPENKESG
ncbi:DUF2244 domain-containing protein [Solemya elarraichensis gill symbiont]|uniref:DUF2244 domain-containing protein n=1 Tax=Solemya elarraichensis gill symbiont TaxID=1918949 RepID=A0A1T2L8P0_9GAMM|nr:DUF2244 domain-containing protein [Solemya elarraichensis gill symbiont]OOZ41430.1 hypothetical protein BOW52_04605 [Solemya elarraichensis gill symbiont]